jgi:hypothetical protein
MIVAIERNRFIYLYKYNQIRVDINQLIDKPIDKLVSMLQTNFNQTLLLFNSAIPLFEQDHEVILLEVDKSKINFYDGIEFSFESIICIYPLTILGSKLLEGKISDDFIVEKPVFENIIESLKVLRSMNFRRSTSQKLLTHFKIDNILNESIISFIEESVNKNILDKKQPQKFNTFLDHLIAFNKTPSYIPDGNIEHISKVGAIAMKYLGKSEEVFTNGPFYKSSLKYKSIINNKSHLDSYLDFISIDDSELKSSYEKMVELISKDYNNVDIFKVSYFFLAFKSYINKHDNNIEGISNEIDELIINDKNTSAFVLSLLGYTFSFENIYEGLHKLLNAPLLKSTNNKKFASLAIAERKLSTSDQKNDSAINIPEKSIKKDYLSTLKEKIKIDSLDSISRVDNDKIELLISAKPIEKISEPIVIYESNNAIPPKDINVIEVADIIENQESKNFNEEETRLNQLPADEILTVHVFRNYILNDQAKTKHKIWSQFLDYYFPSKNDEITYDDLISKLDNKIEVKDKLLKTKKDKDSIKDFFDKYK